MNYKFKPYEKTELIRNHLNLGGSNPDGESIEVTNLYFERGGKPWLGVMGEYHFSRANREDWYRELCKMKAGGINIVATYIFWIHHEEIEGQVDFTGDLDLREFVKESKRAGLDVVIRIGPWVHGECRNGGLPDWLLQKPYKLRENNPQYMERLRTWFTKIYEQVEGLFYKDGGNIIAVQIENEYVHCAEHLKALKDMIVEIGYDAPLYTVTGWNSVTGARIPVDEVVPMFGGYVALPWENHTKKLPPSIHYFFNKMRNDSAIGADLIAKKHNDEWTLPYERYPFATCELGGGIQVTHHRRPIIKGMDIYAASLVKLGSGNNLIGYYMYHGGSNKIGKLSTFNESKATGYPNDYPIISYDFQTALSEYGEVREQYRLLNILHLFVNDFGDVLAPMEAVDSENPVSREDKVSLRYGMRTDGEGGFVFINHYQRLYELDDIKGVYIDTEKVVFPKIDICGDVSFFMPFMMKLGHKILEYATAQPLCKIDDTYFFAAIDGIKPQYKFTDGAVYEHNEDNVITEVDDVKLVTITWNEAKYIRKIDGKLYIGNNCDIYKYNDVICSVQGGEFEYYEWDGNRFVEKKSGVKENTANMTLEDCEEPFEPPYAEELNLGGERARTWKKITTDSDKGMVEISFEGDAIQLYADGQLVADDFYKGIPWRVPAKLIYGKECYLVMSELRDDFYKEY